MFSTTQLDYIEYKVKDMYLKGYKYYLVHTNTNLSTLINSREFKDLTFYFSKEPLERGNDDYGYTISADSLKFDVITQNASRDYTQSRVSQQLLNNKQTFSVPIYEFCMTNTEKVISHSSIIADNEYTYLYSRMYNHEFYLLPLFSCVLVLYLWIRNTFPRTLSRGEKL